ncbi:MAG TPA: bifunctional demethylmenaquinone methyltransferase/2-methoxy-6-polyprenyl-1,4-benzoquinol methylase UbiE [Gammaproteobacteria bacterium]|jgi:demethylmenaquinone methyltransferase/2-methoxy-6-polyprenyl-1,4-benzoquinol methylase|nr:bifunctional demethylmenaquinone methyltransferase/2-methoxy-6-polyprenyl-1,4-benzoquinol methylase UbiE [Gammaproteobacteria bacterium]
MTKNTTDFGFKDVPITEKEKLVGSVFHSVASKYDLMNDLMSFGLHRLWKKFTIQQSGVRRGHFVLDLAGGTGDLTKAFAERVGPQGLTILSDINSSMLAEGRRRLTDEGIIQNVAFVEANAEQLPFKENYFDCITIAFGLRNVTDKIAALHSMYRVLKPGGKLLVLEFSKPLLPILNKIYDQYSFRIIPKIGEWVTGDKESYEYLVESIRKYPDQETLKSHMQKCQFEDVSYHNLTGGIVALHKGFKY